MKYSNFSGISAAVLMLVFPGALFAAASVEPAFREYAHIPASMISVRVPTVIEIPLDGKFFEYPLFAVKDVTDKSSARYIGSYFHRVVSIAPTPIDVVSPRNASSPFMVDENYQTFASFEVPENGAGSVVIELASQKPVTASSLTLSLDNEVALPNTILITSVVYGSMVGAASDVVVLNTVKMSGNTVRFPKTTSAHWKITLGYSQPLRIAELQMNDEDATRATTQGLRFLATPGHSYEIYMSPDRPFLQNFSPTESGDLVTDKGVVRTAPVAIVTNPAYVVLDSDNDGIPDTRDNCTSFANPDQEDVNQNNIGDVCEDFDRDGVINAKDNCPNDPNVAQTDSDGDKIGNACDKEESRITEKNTWLPWAGMGLAGIVVLGLVVLTLRSKGLPKPTDSGGTTPMV